MKAVILKIVPIVFCFSIVACDKEEDNTLRDLLLLNALTNQACVNTGTPRYFSSSGNFSQASAAYSVDGSCWTATRLTGAAGMSGLAFANNTFVGVGSPSTPSAYSATDFTGTWTAGTGLSGTGVLVDVVHTGTRFVAVGVRQLYYSSDGSAWTAATSATTARLDQVISISYMGGTRQVAVGSLVNSGVAIFSNDHGDNWTATTTMPAVNKFLGVAYSGTRLVAVGASGACAYSDDGGANWTQCTLPTTATSQYNGITYANGRFVAVSSGGEGIYYSSDGISWTASSLNGLTSASDGLAFGGDRFVVTGPTPGYSTDGINWTPGQLAAGSAFSPFTGERTIYK